MSIIRRVLVALGAVCGALVLYVVLGVLILMGKNGRPSGSDGGGGGSW